MEAKINLVMRKADKYVRLSCWFTTHLKTGAEVTWFERQPGTWKPDEDVKDGAKKKTLPASHAEGQALFDAEAKALQDKGFVGVLRPFFKLEDTDIELVAQHGGDLAAPVLGEKTATPAVFAASRVQTAITPEADARLRRLADAVGLTATAPNGTPVLLIAVGCGSLSLAEACVAAGASPDAANWRGTTPRELAQGQPGPLKARLLALFEKAGGAARPTAALLHAAAKGGDLAAVEACLAGGVAPDDRGTAGRTALYWAAGATAPSSLAVLERLLQAGASPTADADTLEQALGYQQPAALYLPRLQRLVEAGARPPAALVAEWLGNTSYAAESRRALLSALRGVGAFVGTVPLEAAVTLRDPAAVRAALAAGERPDATSGLPPLHLAAVDGGFHSKGAFHLTLPASAEIVQLLLEGGADPNARAPEDDSLQKDGFGGIYGTLADGDAAKQAKALKADPAATARVAELQRIVALIRAARTKSGRPAQPALAGGDDA